MKRFVFKIVMSFIVCTIAAAQSPFPSGIDSLVMRGIDQTYSCMFDSAMSTFQEIVDLLPDHPIGYFYKAAALQSMMMHYETDQWAREFYRLTGEAVRIGNSRIDADGDDAWTYYYTGSSHAYEGLFKAKMGGLVSGFIGSRKGLGYLSRALEKDSTIYDAYLGLGNFDYWSGRFYKYLDWLPWIRDERERGVQRVRLAVEKGSFSYWVGVNSLAWIEYDRKEYEEALALFQKGLRRYPGSRFFLWGEADTYFRMERYDEAADVYEDILASIVQDRVNNGYNEIICRFKLVRSYLPVERYPEALLHCEAILSRKVDRRVEERLGARIEQTRKYRRQCLKALK